MEQLTVKICQGTTCFVMGGAGLQELIDIIPRKYGNKVNVSGTPCLNMCTEQSGYAKAPFVQIGDDIIVEATVDKVLEEIDRKLR